MSETLYRIDYSVQRRRDGEDDFTEIGFGSSNGWSTPDQAVFMVGADVQNYEWETSGDMPGPREVKDEVEETGHA